MAALSDYAENKLVDHLLGIAAFTMPTTAYLALFTTATTEAGGGTEVSGGSYARVPVTSDMSASSGGVSSNANDLTFPAATANWGTVTHIALFDAASGGNMLMHAALSSPRTVNSGGQLKFAVGDLDVAFQ